MAKRRSKSLKKTPNWLPWARFIVTVIALIIGIYALRITATKRDVQRIVASRGTNVDQQGSPLPAFIPEGRKILDAAEIEKLERDIYEVESSIFFSLSGETYLDIAKFYFNQAKFKNVLEYVDKSLQKSPLNLKTLLLRSILGLYAGLYKEAFSDADTVIGKSQDDRAKAAALLIKGFVSYLTGDLRASKETLYKAAPFFKISDEYKEILILCDFLIAEASFSLGEYDAGDDYYSSVQDIAKQLETLEQKNALTIIILALVNLEGNFKTLIDNYDMLLKVNDEFVFRDLVLRLYKMAMSIIDPEAFLAHVENAIQFCKEYDIVYLEQYFKELLFESWLDSKNSFRKDLWQEIISSPAKIPGTEADMYLVAGEFYQRQKDYETALGYFNGALERYKISSRTKDIIETKIDIYFAEFDLRNYFNAYKILRSALEDIDAILGQNVRQSYISKRANEELADLKSQKEGIKKLLPVIEKFFQ